MLFNDKITNQFNKIRYYHRTYQVNSYTPLINIFLQIQILKINKPL